MSLARYLSKLGALLNSSGQVPSGALASGAAVANIGAGGIAANELATAVKPLGVSQTWTDVTASRAVNTTYTNSTGRPIFISITAVMVNGSPAQITVAGVVTNTTSAFTANANAQASFVVPSGATYSLSSANLSSIYKWLELR